MSQSPYQFPTRQQMREETGKFLRNRPRSPCVDQTPTEIEAYYRQVQIGDRVALRHTQGGTLLYRITTVREVKPKLGRIYTPFGRFYMKSGKDCDAPTGQTRLVVPTDAVLAWALEHRRGEAGYATASDNLSR